VQGNNLNKREKIIYKRASMYGRPKTSRRSSRQAKKKGVSVEGITGQKRKAMDSDENNNEIESGRVNKIMKIKKEHSVLGKKRSTSNEDPRHGRDEDDIEMIRDGEDNNEDHEEVEDAAVEQNDTEKEDKAFKKKVMNDVADQEEEEEAEEVNESNESGI